MKKNRKKKRSIRSCKRIALDFLKAILSIALAIIVPVEIHRLIPDVNLVIMIAIVTFLVIVADQLCSDFLYDVTAAIDHRDELVLSSSIRKPEILDEMDIARLTKFDADVEACLTNAPLPIIDWRWANGTAENLIITCRMGKAITQMLAKVDMTERKYREAAIFPIRRVRVLTSKGVLFLENPNLWTTEEKSEVEKAIGQAVDRFVRCHCPDGAWRFCDASRTSVYITGVDAFAGLPLTVNWNRDGEVTDMVGYDPAWQRVVSVCGKNMTA